MFSKNQMGRKQLRIVAFIKVCCFLQIVAHMSNCSGMMLFHIALANRDCRFFMFCNVMSEAMCQIEISERERACVVARAKLIPARLLFGCRHKTKKRQTLQSCFIDAVSHCARRENLVNITCDLSVVRRDVVRAGFSGSKRARYNFQIVERTLRRHRANVLVLSEMDNNVVQHLLGDVAGKCIGNLFWNVFTRHVSVVPRLPCTFNTNENPPWFVSVVGGKRPKNKPKTKPTKNK
jgi:hypothetical protein